MLLPKFHNLSFKIMAKKNSALYLRNTIFGIEDSLVSTAGLVSGIAIADIYRPDIILSGVVLIFVEAFSMAAGSLISEHSVEEYENHREVSILPAFRGAVLMFFAYFIFGFIPLLPYIFIGVEYAFWLSIIFSLLTLFILGVVSSKFFGTKILKHGFQMLLIGGAAVMVGILAGKFMGPVF